mmetsp:Transcript_96137/g.276173  ORF Transcript_96137/g.276173 Transcript_96137/m.276173 type:complete len:322 (-) Transcript_96137:11-976(-)
MAYRIFGSENSPYSVKVRSYFRYKGIPHEWIPRTGEAMKDLHDGNDEEFNCFAKLQIVPLVVSPDGKAMQDSTPIIEAFEAQIPEPFIHPPGPLLKFLSELLEEFGDEWGNKWMFHLRWAREIDQDIVSLRLARELMPGLPEEQVRGMAASIKGRMTGRGFAVGSNERTALIIESDLCTFLVLLERHLAARPFLFGGRPSLGDLGLGPQLYETLIDPTGGELMRPYPLTSAWCRRMADFAAEPAVPAAGGSAFETWAALAPTLEPLLCSAGVFLRWSVANTRAIESGATEMEAIASVSPLADILARTGCLQFLHEPPAAKL